VLDSWIGKARESALSCPKCVRYMNKKIILGLLSTVVVAVALVVFVFYASQNGGDKRFTVCLEPDEITLRVGEYRNLTVTIVSTGYEGDITVDPNYTFTEEEPQTALEYQIIPGSDEPNARFIEANS